MAEYARLIEIFERLVAFPTITGDKHAAYDCLQYVERALTVAGLETTTYSSNGYESLVATTQATKRPRVFLQAHLDVVPGDEAMFTLRRDGSRLVGRGSFDMKYAAACFLLLVEELRDELPAYDFGLMFTTDEENDGTNGVKYLLDQGYGCDINILPDGGDNWRLETAAKGGWAIKVVAPGKTAHSSRPWEGDNAIERLMDFLGELRTIFPIGAHSDITMAIAQVDGGLTHNQIPDEACAIIDFRYMSDSSYTDAYGKVNEVAKLHKVQFEEIRTLNAVELDPTLPEVQEWEKVVTEVRGEKTDGYALSFGSSDARYFAEHGIPSIVTRPDGGGHHSNEEWIDEAGLYEFYECIKRYVMAIARVSSENRDQKVDSVVEKRYTSTQLPETVTDPLS